MRVRLIAILLISFTLKAVYPIPPVEDRGIYALWYGNDLSILETPFVTGGQIVCQWQEVEPEKGKYDFSVVEQRLRQLKATGRKATVQINGNVKPEWLFDEVPYTSERLSVQVRNKEGTLMYWHPTHRDAYIRMLKHFAEYIKSSTCSDSLMGMRLNFNPVGTEHLHVPDEYHQPEAWIIPPGVTPPEPFSQQVVLQYQDAVVETFVDYISPLVKLFVRNTIKPEIEERYRHLFETGKIGWFHTSSEAEPRSTGLEYKYIRFHKDCRSGTTVGYAEPWASAWGDHGGLEDHRPFSPPQWNYWRLLIDLHCGISYIGIYKNDLNVAINGTYDVGDNHYNETLERLDYQREFARAFQFAAKYAGYHASPEESPGAWVAFRDGHDILARNAKSENQLKLNHFIGDYNFLMERQPDSTMGVHNVGPDTQRFGAWARILPAGQQMKLAVDDAFIKSLKKAVIRVTFLDDKEKEGNHFVVMMNGQRQVIMLKGTNRWKTEKIELTAPYMNEIIIESGNKDVCLHMVEVLRGN